MLVVRSFWPSEGHMLEHSVPEGMYPWEASMLKHLMKNCRACGRTDVGEFSAELSPVAGDEREELSPLQRKEQNV